jgi:hypothetical protein
MNEPTNHPKTTRRKLGSGRRSKIFRALSLLALLVVLAGNWSCHAKHPFSVRRGDADDWLRSLNEARPTLKTVRAEARVEVRKKERHFRFHVSILAEYPSRFFAETSGFGLVAAVVSADEEGVLAFLPSRAEAYRGESAEILGALLGIELPTRDWVSLLLGNLPPHSDKLIRFEDVGGKAVLTLGNQIPRVIMKFDRKTSWLESFEEKFPNTRMITFGEPVETTAGPFPSEIKIETEKASVDLRFHKVTANPTLPPELFRIELPAKLQPQLLRGAELLKGE